MTIILPAIKMGIEVGFFADFPFEQTGCSGSSDIEKFPTPHIFLKWTISNEHAVISRN